MTRFGDGVDDQGDRTDQVGEHGRAVHRGGEVLLQLEPGVEPAHRRGVVLHLAQEARDIGQELGGLLGQRGDRHRQQRSHQGQRGEDHGETAAQRGTRRLTRKDTTGSRPMA